MDIIRNKDPYAVFKAELMIGLMSKMDKDGMYVLETELQPIEFEDIARFDNDECVCNTTSVTFENLNGFIPYIGIFDAVTKELLAFDGMAGEDNFNNDTLTINIDDLTITLN